jgi:hypothetical protein
VNIEDEKIVQITKYRKDIQSNEQYACLRTVKESDIDMIKSTIIPLPLGIKSEMLMAEQI